MKFKPRLSSPPRQSSKIIVGCCAMPSKLVSLPMRTLLNKLVAKGHFDLYLFSETELMELDVTAWPVVDCLIAFYSRGYPLAKVIEYVDLVKPVVLNDLKMQFVLRSRVKVIERLDGAGIPTPKHLRVDHRAVAAGVAQFEESEDYFVYNGVRMDKPFIEKPEDADDHNNYVYYPTNAGGGCKKLFRKLQNRSSEYYADITKIRRDGVYLYEEFLPTLGTDIKVYTVGPSFAHAEARKSPTLDGRVQRTVSGKEERYPVLLTEDEKLIAYSIVKVFKQTVCGFDILRTTTGRAVVCDVNGWSFVKGNSKYSEDCSQILSDLFQKALKHRRVSIRHGMDDPPMCLLDETTLEDYSLSANQYKGSDQSSDCNDDEEWTHDELQTIVVVLRHGDRSPKLKMKFLTKSPRILQMFLSYQKEGGRNKVVKLRTSQDLLAFKRVNDEVLEIESQTLTDQAKSNHLKVQSLLATKELIEITRKVQLVVPKDAQENSNEPPKELLVVVKWGGELTPLGLETSETLGHSLREKLYPQNSEGLLRLHSTFRHDFKIYTSDEGRCQLTAAAFTKGFLDLEGDLPPILVQMVARDAAAQELFEEGEYTKTTKNCKQFIQRLVHMNLVPEDLCKQVLQKMFKVTCPVCCEGKEPSTSSSSSSSENDKSVVNVTRELLAAYHKTLLAIGPIWTRCEMIHEAISAFVTRLSNRLAMEVERQNSIDLGDPTNATTATDSENEWSQQFRKKLTSICNRWKVLDSVWWRLGKIQPVDATKVPEVYDNARYDMLHNAGILRKANLWKDITLIHSNVEVLGPFVFALEFGITPEEKVEIGCKTVPRLIKKIDDDLTFHYKKPLQLESAHLTHRPDFGSPEGDRRDVMASSEGSHDSASQQLPISSRMSLKDSGQKENKEGEAINLKQEDARKMGIKSPWRKVRSRYYTASASHVTSLLNVVTYAEALRRKTTFAIATSDEENSGYRTSALKRETSAQQTLNNVSPNSSAVLISTSMEEESKPPLYVSASDTPYLSHLVIRVWRPAGKCGPSLEDLKVEVTWNRAAPAKNDDPICVASMTCSVADLHDILKACIVEETSM